MIVPLASRRGDHTHCPPIHPTTPRKHFSRPASKASGRGAVICRGPDQARFAPCEPDNLPLLESRPGWSTLPPHHRPSKKASGQASQPAGIPDADGVLGAAAPSLRYCRLFVGAAIGVQRGLQQRVGRRRRLPKHWFLASFAVHRWLDSPSTVKTADGRSSWRAKCSAEAPDHLTRAPLLRTDETTSRIACVVAAASSSFAIRSSWAAPAMTRCTLLVDNLAIWFCAVDQAASCPLPAVRTISGLSAKSRRAAACSIEAVAWTYSSIVLRSMLAVATLARTSSRDRGGRLPKAERAYRRPRPS